MPRWYFNAVTFRYHQQSQIMEDSVEPSFLFKKLISTHVLVISN